MRTWPVSVERIWLLNHERSSVCLTHRQSCMARNMSFQASWLPRYPELKCFVGFKYFLKYFIFICEDSGKWVHFNDLDFIDAKSRYSLRFLRQCSHKCYFFMKFAFCLIPCSQGQSKRFHQIILWMKYVLIYKPKNFMQKRMVSLDFLLVKICSCQISLLSPEVLTNIRFIICTRVLLRTNVKLSYVAFLSSSSFLHVWISG